MRCEVKVFFDTEFTSLTEKPLLISVGMITEDGNRTFYAELNDTYSFSDLSQFAVENVIPLLDGHAISISQLSIDMHHWLVELNDEIELASDNWAWDWPFIVEVLQHNWPSNLNRECYLLNLNYMNDADAYYEAVKCAYKDGLRKHHALDDAKSIRFGWLASEKAKK